mmetsp:Transcript_61052/g.145399  ORF Transcript_61052/g.145399 Transcript_61052/m.145399 type:complete len:209 (-) Transcript_61052:231-857(-)
MILSRGSRLSPLHRRRPHLPTTHLPQWLRPPRPCPRLLSTEEAFLLEGGVRFLASRLLLRVGGAGGQEPAQRTLLLRCLRHLPWRRRTPQQRPRPPPQRHHPPRRRLPLLPVPRIRQQPLRRITRPPPRPHTWQRLRRLGLQRRREPRLPRPSRRRARRQSRRLRRVLPLFRPPHYRPPHQHRHTQERCLPHQGQRSRRRQHQHQHRH